jgi:homoserine/homoserine lactone efflux protein
MMALQTWLLFCATETVLCFTPGPAVLLVVSLSLSRGAVAGLAGSLGILSANALYFALSASSLGALLLASWQLFILTKWLGAAYLIWLGVRMLVRPATVPARPVAGAVPVQSPRRSFSLGFLTQGANPKALVFFTAILPQFIDPQGAFGLQVFVLGVSSVLIEFVVLSIYVATCQTARAWVGSNRLAVPLQRAGGALLIGAGVRLAAIRRQ